MITLVNVVYVTNTLTVMATILMPVKDEGVCCDRCNNTIALAARIKACKDAKD